MLSGAIVLLLLNVNLTFVFLNRLLIFLTYGEECVNVLYVGCEGLWLVEFFSVYCVLIMLEGGCACLCCLGSVCCFINPRVVVPY
jgi:hypothetical protein